MKSLITIFAAAIFSVTSFAQTNDKTLGTIDVQGYSKLSINSDNYVAQIFIQEEEQKVGYATVGKLSIDSVKIIFFLNLKKFGIDEKDLKIVGISSQEIGQYPNYLSNILYEVKLKDKESATKLVNGMRFVGLKGIVIKKILTQTQKDNLADSLYNNALNDAKRIAIELAKKADKTIGEIKMIRITVNPITSFGNDFDTNTNNYNAYTYKKFEMDYQDKYATCVVGVVFEMK